MSSSSADFDSTTGSDSPPGASPPSGSPGSAARDPEPSRLRKLIRRLAVAAVLLLLIGGASLGSAEYYTSRPDFCGTCHVMDPYYKSWSHDKHGAKLGVRCVDCHYAPGERFTIHAKFKGLSQVASYFSGRYGAARPRAHVPDASCMTSGCHGDREFMSKSIPIGEARKEKRLVGTPPVAIEVERRPTVHFSHEKHLGVQHRLEDIEQDIAQKTDQLRASLPNGSFQSVWLATRSVAPAAERESALHDLLAKIGSPQLEDQAVGLLRLEHTALRLKQLSGISCSACHTYNPLGNSHISVSRQACFTCHFTNQEFNQGSGDCLKCHEPPVRRIAVHAMPVGAESSVGLMDHRDIVARGINCASCHRDVIQGDSTVSERECAHCHDQERYLVDFKNRNTDTVEAYHRIHVAGERAQCTDCHRAIEHHLIDPSLVASSDRLLQPILNDCQHCHPSHHHEQVEMLLGVGGAGIDRPMPSGMFGSRVNCQACHTKATVDAKGDRLVKATEASCAACHGSDYERLFRQWQAEIKDSLAEATRSLDRVERRLAEVQKQGRPIPKRVEEIVAQARQNVHLVASANGIHNKGYALQLLDFSTHSLDEAMMMLAQVIPPRGHPGGGHPGG